MNRGTTYAALPLHRETAARAPHKKICALDLETRTPDGADGETGPLYGPIAEQGICLYGNPEDCDRPTPHFFSQMDDVLAEILARYAGFTILAHNGSGYEFNYLLDPLRALVSQSDATPDARQYAVDCIHQGEKIIGYTLTETRAHTLTRGKRAGQVIEKQRRWQFVDTYPLFNMSLAEVAEAFCPELPKLTKEHTRHDWTADNPADVAYLVRDCVTLFIAYRRVEAMAYSVFATRLGRTAGSTALHAFTATIPSGHVYYRAGAAVEAFTRRAYRGGLVLPGMTTEPVNDVALLDMSGAYGYQMQHHTFPVGAPVHTYAYAPGYTGVYAVRVHAPRHLFFGVIAEEHGDGYPLGDFNTVTTSVEMEYAETLGYSFEVYEGYYWTREEPVFQPFMERCQQLELERGMKPLAKILRNSLYGKFCARTTAEQFCLLPRDADAPLGSYPLLDVATGDHVEGLYSLPVTLDAPYLMPIWGVLITAYQRVYVAERAMALYAHGAPTVYVDTDSLCTTRAAIASLMADAPDLLRDSPHYGGWKLECTADVLLASAPKVYALLDSAGRVLRTRAKGLPLKQLAATGLITRDTFSQQNTTRYDYVSAHSISERLRHPKLPLRLVKRRAISLMAQSPGWSYDAKSGSIRPLIVYREPHHQESTPLMTPLGRRQPAATRPAIGHAV